jgi:hypothetical protein
LAMFFDVLDGIDSDDTKAATFLNLMDNGHDFQEALDLLDDSDEQPCWSAGTCEVYSFQGLVKEYVEDLAEQTGMLDEVPEALRGYFDWDAYARDATHDFTYQETAFGWFLFNNN